MQIMHSVSLHLANSQPSMLISFDLNLVNICIYCLLLLKFLITWYTLHMHVNTSNSFPSVDN